MDLLLAVLDVYHKVTIAVVAAINATDVEDGIKCNYNSVLKDVCAGDDN